MNITDYTKEAVGAYRNGTRIIKIAGDEGDLNPIGALGRVLGSIGDPEMNLMGYFVEWDKHQGIPVFVMSHKIRKIG